MMEFQFAAINYLYLIAFVMAACLAVFSAMVARHFGARLWVAVMISFAIWTLGETIANMGTMLAWQLGFLIWLNNLTPVQKALDEISRLASTDSLLKVADIDNFKILNDRFGHEAMYEGKALAQGRNRVVAAF
jgi:predicted signal transduction protein with EAL and GGDEF domain